MLGSTRPWLSLIVRQAILDIAYSAMLTLQHIPRLNCLVGKDVDEVNAAMRTADKGMEATMINPDSRVYLAVSHWNLILSTMPSQILGLVELSGYIRGRNIRLKLLDNAGGWTKESQSPPFLTVRSSVRIICICPVDAADGTEKAQGARYPT